MAPRKTTPKVAVAKKSYAEAMTELLQESRKEVICEICMTEEREVIEKSRANGASFPIIAKAMQKIGVMSPNKSLRTARDRVALHFQVHIEDPFDGYPKGTNGRPGGPIK